MDGSATLGSATLVGGAANLTLSTLAVGSHSITAVYGGASGLLGSTSTALPQTVNQATPSIALTSSLNPSNPGQSVMFTATVTGPGGTPTGTVTFKDGSTIIGGSVTLSAGVATSTTAVTA